MGQKINPTGFRLGITKTWSSKWYAEGVNYSKFISSDYKIREFIRNKLAEASISRVEIERPRNSAQVTIFTSRPGIVIGKNGKDIEELKIELSKISGVATSINIEEIRRPELDAYLVADSVAKQLERRVMFRRAMKRAVSATMKLGALGIKISISGRLNGAEIARTEWYREGRVPLPTLRADIDYSIAEAHTTYGVIGVKVWIFKGENTINNMDKILPIDKPQDDKARKDKNINRKTKTSHTINLE